MLSFLLQGILVIASFTVVLSVLVFFHELGHYSVARLFKVAIERFSVGFGKPILKHKAKSGTEWVVGRVPLGGYVKFLGDAGAASNPDLEQLQEIEAEMQAAHGQDIVKHCFHFKPLWQRALIVLAGPMANFLLAIIFFTLVALMYGRTEISSYVQKVVPDSAAEEAGVQVGDQFLSLDDHDVTLSEDFISYVALRSGITLEARVQRGDEIVTFPLTPRRIERRDGFGGISAIGTVGVSIGGPEAAVQYKYDNPWQALGRGTEQFGKTISMTGTYIRRIFQGREDGKALGGPVRIATITGKTSIDVISMDVPFIERVSILFGSLLSLAAALSIGLGVANLMPIPALDGGHLLYYGYEALAGRPLSIKKQEYGFRIGFALLITALVFLTINDIGYMRSMFS